MVKIWDIWVRLFHWSFAITVGYLLISGETSFKFIDWHRRAGEIALCLILFRVAWGFFGSSTARLLPLFKSPREVVSHLGGLFKRRSAAEHHYGHNAAGGYAVLALLLVVSIQAVTGMFIADEDEFIEGRFYGVVSRDVGDFLYEVHHWNAQLIQILVLAHIAMILFYWLYAKTNLLKPMLTGFGVANSDVHEPTSEPKIASGWYGLIFAIVVGMVFYFVFVR